MHSLFGLCAVLPFQVRIWNGLALSELRVAVASVALAPFATLWFVRLVRAAVCDAWLVAHESTSVAFADDAVAADDLGGKGCDLSAVSAFVRERHVDAADCGARAGTVGLARGRRCPQWLCSYLHFCVMGYVSEGAPSLPDSQPALFDSDDSRPVLRFVSVVALSLLLTVPAAIALDDFQPVSANVVLPSSLVGGLALACLWPSPMVLLLMLAAIPVLLLVDSSDGFGSCCGAHSTTLACGWIVG